VAKSAQGQSRGGSARGGSRQGFLVVGRASSQVTHILARCRGAAAPAASSQQLVSAAAILSISSSSSSSSGGGGGGGGGGSKAHLRPFPAVMIRGHTPPAVSACRGNTIGQGHAEAAEAVAHQVASTSDRLIRICSQRRSCSSDTSVSAPITALRRIRKIAGGTCVSSATKAKALNTDLMPALCGTPVSPRRPRSYSSRFEAS
jgi:hypothetical protein